MTVRYARGIPEGTAPADRAAGALLTEAQMLLEMEVRLQVAARHNQIEVDADRPGWWASRLHTEEQAAAFTPPADPPSGQSMLVMVPYAALEAQGRAKTAESLGMVVEVTTHASLVNEGLPEHLRTGDLASDLATVAYIAGAARDSVSTLALTGRLESSQAGLPDAEREPLFIDLEYFDDMIAERYGKRLSEADVYRETAAAEARHFDPATSDVAREVCRGVTGGRGVPAPAADLPAPVAALCERLPAFPWQVDAAGIRAETLAGRMTPVGAVAGWSQTPERMDEILAEPDLSETAREIRGAMRELGPVVDTNPNHDSDVVEELALRLAVGRAVDADPAGALARRMTRADPATLERLSAAAARPDTELGCGVAAALGAAPRAPGPEPDAPAHPRAPRPGGYPDAEAAVRPPAAAAPRAPARER